LSEFSHGRGKGSNFRFFDAGRYGNKLFCDPPFLEIIRRHGVIFFREAGGIFPFSFAFFSRSEMLRAPFFFKLPKRKRGDFPPSYLIFPFPFCPGKSAAGGKIPPFFLGRDRPLFFFCFFLLGSTQKLVWAGLFSCFRGGGGRGEQPPPPSSPSRGGNGELLFFLNEDKESSSIASLFVFLFPFIENLFFFFSVSFNSTASPFFFCCFPSSLLREDHSPSKN